MAKGIGLSHNEICFADDDSSSSSSDSDSMTDMSVPEDCGCFASSNLMTGKKPNTLLRYTFEMSPSPKTCKLCIKA